MNNYKLTLDGYTTQYDNSGFISHITALVYIRGIEGESEERIVELEPFSKFIDEEDIEGYLNNETMSHIEADLEVYINKVEGRKYNYVPVEIHNN